MVFLNVLLTFILLMTPLFAEEAAKNNVQFDCQPVGKCEDLILRLRLEKAEDLEEKIRVIALDKSFKFVQIEKDGFELKKVILRIKPNLKEVIFDIPGELDRDQIFKITQLQEDVLFEERMAQQSKKRVEDWLFERGYLSPSFDYKIKKTSSGDVSLNIKISYREKLKLNKIKVIGRTNKVADEYLLTIQKLKRKPYSRITFKLAIDNFVTQLKREGYLNAKVSFVDTIAPPNVTIDLNVSLGERYQFSFFGNDLIDRNDLVLAINSSVLDGSSLVDKDSINTLVKDFYEKKGLYGTKVSSYEKVGKNIDGDNIRTFFFKVDEGRKIPVKEISFKGNVKVDLALIKEEFYKRGSILSKRDFLDNNYLNGFTTILKSFYLNRGFVFIDISKPIITFEDEGRMAKVSYLIKERQQSFLTGISLQGIPDKYKEEVLKKLKNQVGSPLNVIELEKDLSRALNAVRNLGFYFAKITNLEKDDVVTYDSNYTKSKIRLVFDAGKITSLENVLISGNKDTKDKVISREVYKLDETLNIKPLRRGDIITPDIVKNIRDNINRLGLFANVQVLPIVLNKLSDEEVNKTNLVIQVREKKFGRGEFAPGYRTDIGAKASFTISRTNLLGYNDSGTLKLQLNRRFTLSQFDSRRAAENNIKLEGSATLNYRFPSLFDLGDFNSSFSVQRRQFFSFDADIFRVSPQLNKQVNKVLGLSLKYQYERIRQFDATEDRDFATFEIGSLTPGITLDFRDSNVSPRSGAYFGLNWEFANRYFGSQRNSDVEINFSKVISRNRFYIPLNRRKSFVLALSVAGGMQENYADEENGFNDDGSVRTTGYIPSIKVFRLDGFDIVRGFADGEINKLDDGQDIIEKRIQGKAYFVNFKIEPRYYIDDTLVIGPFFDAGRLFVDTIRPADLRTSAGLTLKLLTPVGTLDFDYGIKLNRRTLDGGLRESFGRFNLSIGYF